MIDDLCAYVERTAPAGAIVAFSGGVDSSLVAAVAVRALGPSRCVAVTAVSPALASGELSGARSVAAAIGIPWRSVSTDELSRPGYVANDVDRCFHCKSELYARLSMLCGDGQVLMSGANADDVGDWRPGLRAASGFGVVHPLLDCGVGKPAVRSLAAALGVPSAAKPASPCLASRIPYGTPVSPDVLSLIDRAEAAVRARGFTELRVRHYGSLGRVEIGADELPRALEPAERHELERAVREAGYETVVIADRPLRSGSLNVHLTTR